MIKHFYSFLIDTDPLLRELEKSDIQDDEKRYLHGLIESHIHHAIVDLVLSELHEHDKKLFLKHLNSNSHEKIWKLLHNNIEKVDEKIHKAAHELKKEFFKDIESAKTKK